MQSYSSKIIVVIFKVAQIRNIKDLVVKSIITERDAKIITNLVGLRASIIQTTVLYQLPRSLERTKSLIKVLCSTLQFKKNQAVHDISTQILKSHLYCLVIAPTSIISLDRHAECLGSNLLPRSAASR